MQIKALTLNIFHLLKTAQLKYSPMSFWTTCPCPSLCFPAKVTNQNWIKSWRKHFWKLHMHSTWDHSFNLWHQASFPQINETLQQARSHFSTQQGSTLFNQPADKLVLMWLLLWNVVVHQPHRRHSRSQKPSMTLSSNHQGNPGSQTTHLSVMATVPKYLWSMVSEYFFGVNSNWISFSWMLCEQLTNCLAEVNFI